MQLLRFKRKLNDYFVGLVLNDDGFSWVPYSEFMSGSPYGEWQSFKETTYNWLWWRIYIAKGYFNMNRYRLKNAR